MPFKTFLNWIYDGYVDSEIPNPELLLKYNSPITNTYMISLFVKIGKINHYLDKYMNNINLRYIKKEELMIYIKKLIIDNKIKRFQLHYFIYRRYHKLFDILKEKFSYLKNNEIQMLCDQINNSDEKETIYQSLGIMKPKIEKVKKIKKEKISLKEFIRDNFSIIDMEESQ